MLHFVDKGRVTPSLLLFRLVLLLQVQHFFRRTWCVQPILLTEGGLCHRTWVSTHCLSGFYGWSLINLVLQFVHYALYFGRLIVFNGDHLFVLFLVLSFLILWQIAFDIASVWLCWRCHVLELYFTEIMSLQSWSSSIVGFFYGFNDLVGAFKMELWISLRWERLP